MFVTDACLRIHGISWVFLPIAGPRLQILVNTSMCIICSPFFGHTRFANRLAILEHQMESVPLCFRVLVAAIVIRNIFGFNPSWRYPFLRLYAIYPSAVFYLHSISCRHLGQLENIPILSLSLHMTPWFSNIWIKLKCHLQGSEGRIRNLIHMKISIRTYLTISNCVWIHRAFTCWTHPCNGDKVQTWPGPRNPQKICMVSNDKNPFQPTLHFIAMMKIIAYIARRDLYSWAISPFHYFNKFAGVYHTIKSFIDDSLITKQHLC